MRYVEQGAGVGKGFISTEYIRHRDLLEEFLEDMEALERNKTPVRYYVDRQGSCEIRPLSGRFPSSGRESWTHSQLDYPVLIHAVEHFGEELFTL